MYKRQKLVLPNKQEQKLEDVESGFDFPRKEHCPQSLYDDQLKYFVECIAQRQKPNPGGLEGLINMKVIDAAYQSAQTGEAVKIEGVL